MVEVLSITEWAEFWSGDSDASMLTSHRALQIADTDTQRLHTLLSLVSAGLDMRRWDVVEEASENVEQLLPGARDAEAIRAQALRGHAAYYRGDVRTARELMVGLKDTEATIAQKAATLNTLGMINVALADYASANRCFEEASEIATGFGRSLTSHIEDNIAFLDAALGRHHEALKQLQWIRDNSGSLDPTMLCSVLMHIGTTLRREGDLVASSEATESALEIVGAKRDPYLAHNSRANLAITEGLLGRSRRGALRRIQSDASAAGLSFVRLKALMFQGILADLEGDSSEAVALLEECLPEQLELGHINLVAQELCLLPGLAGRVFRRHNRNQLGPPLINALSKHWHFSEVAPALRELGVPHMTMWLAHASSDMTHAVPVRQSIEHGEDRTQSLSRMSDLTSREAEVLGLMAGNHSNEEIAAELFIALSTVKTHVNHILRKLDQKTRIGAILEYQRLAQSSSPTPRPKINPGYDSSGTSRD